MKKILLVEDNSFLIDIYTKKLQEAGFDVEVAENGEEALEKSVETQPDLIVLDIVLPRVAGWEVLEKIRQNDKLKKIPVVILSNLGQKEEINKGLNLGATKYLIKAHYTPSQVVAEIKKLLNYGKQ